MSLKTSGFCVSCGKTVNDKYKYCYNCNFSSEKVECEGWFNKPCPNYTTNEIQRCIEHCINFCSEESTGKRKSTLRHLQNKCCTPKTCCKCGKVLFGKYHCCYRCHTQKNNNEKNVTSSRHVTTSNYEFIDDDDDDE